MLSAQSQSRGGGGDRNEKDERTLFVRGIPYDADEDQLRTVEIFAEATAVRITRDKETGESRGFGFVEFATEAECEAAMEARFEAQLSGRNLFFDRCGSKSSKNQGGGRGGRGDRGGRGRGRGGDRGGRGRGRGGFGDRGGRGRGGARGRGGRGGFAAAKNKGSIQAFEGKKMTFDDSD